MRLIDHEDLTGFHNNARFIHQLVNINATVEFLFFDVDRQERRDILRLVHLLPDGIKYTDRVRPVVAFLKFKIDHGRRRVRIGFNIFRLGSVRVIKGARLCERCKF